MRYRLKLRRDNSSRTTNTTLTAWNVCSPFSARGSAVPGVAGVMAFSLSFSSSHVSL